MGNALNRCPYIATGWKTLDMMYRVKIAKLIYNIYYEATYAPMYERPYQETQDKT